MKLDVFYHNHFGLQTKITKLNMYSLKHLYIQVVKDYIAFICMKRIEILIGKFHKR